MTGFGGQVVEPPHGLARGHDERGAASVEAVIVLPAVLLLLGLLLVGGRYWYVHTAVEEASWVAARGASLERTGSAAQRSAHRIAGEQLRATGTECADLRVHLDVAGFDSPVGNPASVGVQVHCRVPLADLLVPGTPGSVEVSGRGDSPIDRHRGRS